MSSCVDIVLKHGIFVCSFEQIIHCCLRLLGEGFKEGCTRADTPFKNLQDDIHAVRFHLEYGLPEPLHEFPQ